MSHKFYSTILVLLLFVAIEQKDCKKSNVPKDCIDKSKITNAVCTADYNPVCGCDGKTYSNECVAKSAGLLKFEKGECKK